MRTIVVKYGRSIECGTFGETKHTGKVWFGWEVELESGDTVEAVEAKLRETADTVERDERVTWEEREENLRLSRRERALRRETT